jgi:hypothetical protein
MDQIRDEDCNDDIWLENIAVAQAMKKLSDRERAIISMRLLVVRRYPHDSSLIKSCPLESVNSMTAP